MEKPKKNITTLKSREIKFGELDSVYATLPAPTIQTGLTAPQALIRGDPAKFNARRQLVEGYSANPVSP